VRQRIDHTSLEDIGTQLLDDIVSKDPRATQGIGGDNMTFLLVDLRTKSRNKHSLPVNHNSMDDDHTHNQDIGTNNDLQDITP